jgi:hypothetical protein
LEAVSTAKSKMKRKTPSPARGQLFVSAECRAERRSSPTTL